MPTGMPAELATFFDNTALLIGSIGLATIVVIYTISGWKWGRGLS